MSAKKVRSGGISIGSQNFRAVAARATIVMRVRGLNNTPQTNPLRGVTYPCARYNPGIKTVTKEYYRYYSSNYRCSTNSHLSCDQIK